MLWSKKLVKNKRSIGEPMYIGTCLFSSLWVFTNGKWADKVSCQSECF